MNEYYISVLLASKFIIMRIYLLDNASKIKSMSTILPLPLSPPPLPTSIPTTGSSSPMHLTSGGWKTCSCFPPATTITSLSPSKLTRWWLRQGPGILWSGAGQIDSLPDSSLDTMFLGITRDSSTFR